MKSLYLEDRQEIAKSIGSLAQERGRSLVVAFGSEAVNVVSQMPEKPPTIASMILTGSGQTEGGLEFLQCRVGLDVPFPAVLEELIRIAPGKTRLGILRFMCPDMSSRAQLNAAARDKGYILRIADCVGPEDLPSAFGRLRTQVDFIFCPPDGRLFNSNTIRPLLTDSLSHRIPLIGFSENFVRAGAAIGIYPDYTEIGRQTADVANRILEGKAVPPHQYPHRVRLALNEKVIRIIGADFIRTKGLPSNVWMFR